MHEQLSMMGFLAGREGVSGVSSTQLMCSMMLGFISRWKSA